jgi:hypothetical protein
MEQPLLKCMRGMEDQDDDNVILPFKGNKSDWVGLGWVEISYYYGRGKHRLSACATVMVRPVPKRI